MEDEMSIRPATPEDVQADIMMGDTWTLRRLQVDRRVAIQTATEQWGPPGRSVLPGELLWRLRVDEAIPVYVSICQGEEPVVMFNACSGPDRATEEMILDLLGTMLVRGGVDTD